MQDSDKAVKEKLTKYRSEAAMLLTRALGIASDEKDILNLLWAMAYIGKGVEESVETLAKYISSPSQKIRTATIGALGGIGTARCADLLIPIVESGPWEIFEGSYWAGRDGHTALVALRNIGENANSILPRLIKLLKSDLSDRTKVGICITLSKIGDTDGQVTKAIASYISIQEKEVDPEIIMALYHIFFNGGIPFYGLDNLLKRLFFHDNGEVVRWAKLAFGKMEEIRNRQN